MGVTSLSVSSVSTSYILYLLFYWISLLLLKIIVIFTILRNYHGMLSAGDHQVLEANMRNVSEKAKLTVCISILR